MPSRVKVLSKAELESMHTGSLMARRKALLACEESVELSDTDDDYVADPATIEFKQTEQWAVAYNDVKTVLNARENWSRGK